MSQYRQPPQEAWEPEYSPVPYAARFFPRPHPSADTASKLGLLSLAGLGPLAGIPAILLARLVQREIAKSNGRYRGEGDARGAVLTGAIGACGFGLLYLYLACAASQTAALIVFGTGAVLGLGAGAGQLLPASPWPLPALAQLTRKAPIVVGLSMLGLMAVGSAGYFRRAAHLESELNAAAMACAEHGRAAETAATSGDFPTARRELADAQTSCVGADLAARRAAASELPSRQDAWDRRVAAEEQAREEQAQAAREAKAATAFVVAVPRVAEYLKRAAAQTASARWADADSALDAARSELSPYLDSPIAKSDRWRQLDAETQALAARIQPGLDHQRKVDEARAHQAAVIEQAKERQRAAVEAARERAEEASQRVARSGLMCRDGTLSPTCTCGGRRRGCCSHHGGVAGCE